MPDLHRYVFRTTWRFTSPPDVVFDALADVARYSQWWPQVRAAREVEPGVGEIVVRSKLPYDLVVGLRAVRRDADSGVLVAALSGDLTGWSGWQVRAIDGEGADDGAGEGQDGSDGCCTEAVFNEDVVARKRLLRTFALVARPAFVANHALMMRSGQAGLRAWLDEQ